MKENPCLKLCRLSQSLFPQGPPTGRALSKIPSNVAHAIVRIVSDFGPWRFYNPSLSRTSSPTVRPKPRSRSATTDSRKPTDDLGTTQRSSVVS